MNKFSPYTGSPSPTTERMGDSRVRQSNSGISAQFRNEWQIDQIQVFLMWHSVSVRPSVVKRFSVVNKLTLARYVPSLRAQVIQEWGRAILELVLSLEIPTFSSSVAKSFSVVNKLSLVCHVPPLRAQVIQEWGRAIMEL